MKSRYVALAILFLVNISCNEEASPITQKPTAAICNELLSGICSGNDNTGYCTFGYKWGRDNPFANAGGGKPGPASGATEVSYKFQDSGLVFDTHSQRGVTSVSFDNILNCSRQQVRNAFTAWEAVANVKFVEKSSQETADIKLILANITQGGIAYPPIPNQTCSGLVILKSTSNYSCDNFYSLVVHEIGHVLGLGHVTSNNVMNPGVSLRELQAGDIEGVRSIYGKK